METTCALFADTRSLREAARGRQITRDRSLYSCGAEPRWEPRWELRADERQAGSLVGWRAHMGTGTGQALSHGQDASIMAHAALSAHTRSAGSPEFLILRQSGLTKVVRLTALRVLQQRTDHRTTVGHGRHEGYRHASVAIAAVATAAAAAAVAAICIAESCCRY